MDRDALMDVDEDVRLDRGDRDRATGAMVAKTPLWGEQRCEGQGMVVGLKGVCRSHRT